MTEAIDRKQFLAYSEEIFQITLWKKKLNESKFDLLDFLWRLDHTPYIAV